MWVNVIDWNPVCVPVKYRVSSIRYGHVLRPCAAHWLWLIPPRVCAGDLPIRRELPNGFWSSWVWTEPGVTRVHMRTIGFQAIKWIYKVYNENGTCRYKERLWLGNDRILLFITDYTFWTSFSFPLCML